MVDSSCQKERDSPGMQVDGKLERVRAISLRLLYGLKSACEAVVDSNRERGEYAGFEWIEGELDLLEFGCFERFEFWVKASGDKRVSGYE